MNSAPDLENTLTRLFEAERLVRELRAQVADQKPGEVFELLGKAATEARALAGQGDEAEEEAALRFEVIAMLLGDQGGSRAVDALIEVLAEAPEPARDVAGEQLERLAMSRFREFGKAIERALDRLPVGSPALVQLPFVLGGIPEDGVLPLLRRFLKHADPQAVAAAIEVVVEREELGLIEDIEQLEEDKRPVPVLFENDRPGEITLGQLASDALDALGGDLAEGAAPEDDLRRS
jgi:hypothetical protein